MPYWKNTLPWYLKGMTLALASFEAGQNIPEHSHENPFFCLALHGVCAETYRGKLRAFRPSTLSFLPADHNHSLKFFDSGMQSFSIEVNSALAGEAEQYSLDLNRTTHCSGGKLVHLYYRTYAEFVHRDAGAALVVEGLVREMLAEVSRAMRKSVEEKQQPIWLKRAQELLHEKYREPLVLSQIAVAVGVHPVHLSRTFRQYYHCTLGEYVRRLRIEHASRSMLSSHSSIAEIAARAGFADQAHFSRTFKRILGLTPSEYRSSHQTKLRPF
jgi:AraC family transcriptional regulator